jgi:hypothetical protein
MKRFSLRLPDDLHAALQQISEKEYRSLHSQILIVLEEYVRLAEVEQLENLLEPQEAGRGTEEVLIIMDGDNNQPINLLELPAQSLAVFGTRNRHFLRVFSWDPGSEDSRQEFQALAEAGYHVRRWE